MPKIVTNADRAAEIMALRNELSNATHAAITAEANAPGTDATREAWTAVATLAGNVQRRSRILAGLGRGG